MSFTKISEDVNMHWIKSDTHTHTKGGGETERGREQNKQMREHQRIQKKKEVSYGRLLNIEDN